MPIPALAPDDSPLDPLPLSLPARAVGVVVYEDSCVKVPTAEEATTTVVIVVKPVVPSLVIGTTDVDSKLMEEKDTDVLVVTRVSGVKVEVSSLEVLSAVELVTVRSLVLVEADEV